MDDESHVEQREPDFVILHLSDLHMGPYLQDTHGRGEHSDYAPPHDFRLLLGLTTKVKSILNEYEDRIIVTVTGDLTTAAEPPAYDVMYNFLTASVYVSSKCRVGLELSRLKERLCVVPGNHDVWLYGDPLSQWQENANRRDLYVNYFPEPLPRVYPLVVNRRSVALYAIDSNRVSDWLNVRNLRNVLGTGAVGSYQIDRLRVLHTSQLQPEQPLSASDYDYESSLKVAVMHHHLSPPEDATNRLREHMLRLEDATDVLRLLHDIDVRLVLCGHQHKPYQIDNLKSDDSVRHPIVLSCAGSATQCKCEENSFQLYKFFVEEDHTHLVRTVTYVAKPAEHCWMFQPSRDATFRLSGN